MSFSFSTLKNWMFAPENGSSKKSTLAVAPAAAEMYHDIYDFSYMPFSYGDSITWGVLSAIRCLQAGRKGVHVHLICDVKNSGCSVMTPMANVTELYMLELLPSFTSNPCFSTLTLHSSQAGFDEYWQVLSATDSVAAARYQEHLSIFARRRNIFEVLEYFHSRCSRHDEINKWHAIHGDFPRLRVMPECAMDVQALKAAYPQGTFWVTLHCRLLKMDDTLKATRPGTDMTRDGNFGQWYNFIERANWLFPHVRFILLGRMQEKPIALLRLPNVVMPRVLGMTMGHEIALIDSADLFMGTLSGPAQVASFSRTKYAMIRCTLDGCKNIGVPFGHPQALYADPMQRLYYGPDTSEKLLEILEEYLVAANKRTGYSIPSTTNRFFITAQQEEREIHNLLHSQLRALLIKFDDGQTEAERIIIKKEIRDELLVLQNSFPGDIVQFPEFLLLRELTDVEQAPPSTEEERAAAEARNQTLLGRFYQKIDLKELVRGGTNDWFPIPAPGCSGLRADGWCEKVTTLRLARAKAGDYIVFAWRGTADKQPLEMEIEVGNETPFRQVMPASYSECQILLTQDYTRIPITIRFAAEYPLNLPLDPYIASANLQFAVLKALPSRLAREPFGQFFALAGTTGLRADGWCSELTKIKMDSSEAGDSVVFEWLNTVGGQPIEVEIHISGETPVRALLTGKESSNRVLLSSAHPCTEITLKFSSSSALGPNDPHVASALLLTVQIESPGRD